MSEKLVKVIEEEKDRIVEHAAHYMEVYKKEAIEKIEARFNELAEAMQTTLPKGSADMVEMMWRGCIFKTAEAAVTEDMTPLKLDVGNTTLIGPYMWNGQWLKKGIYRLTLIIEPLEEKP